MRNKAIDGIGRFTIESLPHIIKAHPEIEFIILCDKNFNEDYFDFPNVKKKYVFPPYRHSLLYFFYFEVVLPVVLNRIKPDLFVSMEGFLSLRSKCRQLPVIYDLNFEHYPQDLPFKNRIYFRTFFKKFAKKATRIATISEHSKQDIASSYHIDPSVIDNVSCGVTQTFAELSRHEKQITINKYSNGLPYFFFVGSMHPRKNIIRLLQAFENFKKIAPSPHNLILAGHILWDDESIKQILNASSVKANIIFTGRVSDDVLRSLLGASACLTFVPTFEGFGLPIVEAFQAGVPVICSNTTSMPEVAGNACLQVDPFDVLAIASAMKRISEDEDLRSRLIVAGHERKKMFTWHNTASLFYDSMRKAALI
ncbi:MAG: glycosyltransferase family 1 protein [Ferruginibacter sp.]